MGLINDLVNQARARPRPARLTVNLREVRGLAEYIRSQARSLHDITDIADIVSQLMAGQVRLLDVPLHVDRRA